MCIRDSSQNAPGVFAVAGQLQKRHALHALVVDGKVRVDDVLVIELLIELRRFTDEPVSYTQLDVYKRQIMPSIREIYDVLFDFAPAYMKMDWDNVGLVCGKFDTEVHRILVALDPMMDVFEEAKEMCIRDRSSTM